MATNDSSVTQRQQPTLQHKTRAASETTPRSGKRQRQHVSAAASPSASPSASPWIRAVSRLVAAFDTGGCGTGVLSGFTLLSVGDTDIAVAVAPSAGANGSGTDTTTTTSSTSATLSRCGMAGSGSAASVDVQVLVTGPAGTPYEEGCFRLRLAVPPSFPRLPPRAFFTTKIFHPNVSPSTGEVCVDTLTSAWDQKMASLEHIFVTLRCLLIHPNPDSALNADAAHLFLTDYDAFALRVRLLASIHARHPQGFPAPRCTGGSGSGDATAVAPPPGAVGGLVGCHAASAAAEGGSKGNDFAAEAAHTGAVRVPKKHKARATAAKKQHPSKARLRRL